MSVGHFTSEAGPDRLRCLADQRMDRLVELLRIAQSVSVHGDLSRDRKRGVWKRAVDFAQYPNAQFEVVTLDVDGREDPSAGIGNLR